MSYPEPLGILVVDDDSSLIRTLSDVLRLHGYNPATATTASDGLSAVAAMERPPAVALVDLRLPDMSGLDLVARLHEISAHTQVVVLTGNASIDTAVAAMRESSIDYLIKPVRVEQLLRAVAIAGERWQRQLAEVALRDSEERYRLLFENNPQPLFVVDQKSDAIMAVNAAAVARYGFSEEQLLRMQAGDLRDSERHEPTPDGVAPPHNGVLEYHRTAMGEVLEVEVTGHELLFDGRVARLTMVLDVTERHRALRTLRQRDRQQAAIASLGQQAVGLRDLHTLFSTASQVVAETLGVEFASVDEHVPERKSLLVRAVAGWGPALIGILLREGQGSHSGYALQSGEPVVMSESEERFQLHPARQAENVRGGVAVVIPGPHRPFGVLAVHSREWRDFSRDEIHFLEAVAHIVGMSVGRALTDTSLRQSQRLEAVGRLAGGVAHDFNNLLTAITGYSQLLLGELPPDSPMREDVVEIEKAAARAAGLTRQLLAFTRQQVMQPRVINLNDIISDVEKMLDRLIGDDVTLETVLQPGLGSVVADPGQVEQVIVNLVVNARDAMPNGGAVILQTSNEELDDAYVAEHGNVRPGPYVLLSVSDLGEGMDRETQARIFEPFFTTKGPDEGTGLGLSTVYGIVKQTGGYIWVYSEVGHGTTFKIYLPRVFETATRSPREPLPAIARSGTETILLVEDNATVRALAERILTTAGYRIILAGDGEEAMRFMQESSQHIDLLVTDVVMPNMMGSELVERLSGSHAGLKVLYLSGHTDSTLQRQGLVPAGRTLLRKPFAADTLLRKIREALDQE
jgi:PAS domain S-box-containing protein